MAPGRGRLSSPALAGAPGRWWQQDHTDQGRGRQMPFPPGWPVLRGTRCSSGDRRPSFPGAQFSGGWGVRPSPQTPQGGKGMHVVWTGAHVLGEAASLPGSSGSGPWKLGGAWRAVPPPPGAGWAAPGGALACWCLCGRGESDTSSGSPAPAPGPPGPCGDGSAHPVRSRAPSGPPAVDGQAGSLPSCGETVSERVSKLT